MLMDLPLATHFNVASLSNCWLHGVLLVMGRPDETGDWSGESWWFHLIVNCLWIFETLIALSLGIVSCRISSLNVFVLMTAAPSTIL